MKQTKFIPLFFIFVVFGMSSLNAQYRSMQQGSIAPMKVGSVIFNVGLGAGAEYKGDYYNSPFGTKASLEWGLWHGGPGVITLGGEVGASYSSGGYYDNYRTQTMIVAARSAWHYGWKVRGLDTYAGFSAGLGFHHYQYNNDGDYSRNEVIPVPGAFIGASYFITPVFGFNAEAGYDITIVQVGIVLKVR
jgi:hypothetical protein